jgi:antirestriction protein ArdC
MNAYEVITARLIEKLEAGVIPWKQPWKNSAHGAYLPTNFATGRGYRGINLAMLLCSGYGSQQWMTYKQAEELGANVRKGERGTPVVFWKFPGKAANEDGAMVREKGAPLCRYYTVFNVEQIDGLPVDLPFEDAPFDAIESAQRIVDAHMASASHPELKHGGASACYVLTYDTVYMPKPQSFVTPEKYYSTLFHELGHSTRHPRRLDRKKEDARFGSKDYATEELVAEFTAAFLCAESGIVSEDVDAHNAAYIKDWLDVFKADSRVAVMAAQRAQKAADFILGRAAFDAAEEAREESAVAA